MATPAQREAILLHGFKLQRLFPNADQAAPTTLCKQLFRIENKAHRNAEALCNGDIEQGAAEKVSDSCLKAADRLLGFEASDIPVFINMDPRGHALKIDDAWMKEHDTDITRDWGGYGIIAPKIDKKGRS